MALDDLHARAHDGVKERGGDLADAAARLLHHDAVLDGAGGLIALVGCARPGERVQGEHLARGDHVAVERLRAEADVRVARGGGGGLRRKGGEQRVLFLQLGLGDGGLRLDHGRDDGRRIRALGDRRLDVLAELLLVHGKARGLVREGKGLGLRVELFDRGVLCRDVDGLGDLLDKGVHAVRGHHAGRRKVQGLLAQGRDLVVALLQLALLGVVIRLHDHLIRVVAGKERQRKALSPVFHGDDALVGLLLLAREDLLAHLVVGAAAHVLPVDGDAGVEALHVHRGLHLLQRVVGVRVEEPEHAAHREQRDGDAEQNGHGLSAAALLFLPVRREAARLPVRLRGRGLGRGIPGLGLLRGGGRLLPRCSVFFDMFFALRLGVRRALLIFAGILLFCHVFDLPLFRRGGRLLCVPF